MSSMKDVKEVKKEEKEEKTVKQTNTKSPEVKYPIEPGIDRTTEVGEEEARDVVFSNVTPSKNLCSHTRFRQIEKIKRPGIINILVVCRFCRRAGEEIITTQGNSKTVYTSRVFRWL